MTALRTPAAFGCQCLFGCQGLDEVGPAHDADELAIEHDRQTADLPVLQNRGGRLDTPHGTDRDDPAGHHLADRGADRLLVLTREPLAVLEEPAPPGPCLLYTSPSP